MERIRGFRSRVWWGNRLWHSGRLIGLIHLLEERILSFSAV